MIILLINSTLFKNYLLSKYCDKLMELTIYLNLLPSIPHKQQSVIALIDITLYIKYNKILNRGSLQSKATSPKPFPCINISPFSLFLITYRDPLSKNCNFIILK